MPSLSRLARGGLGLEPRKFLRMHHAYCVCIAYDTTGITIRVTCHILFVLFIPNEFPRLLAKREIIANAYFFTTMSGYPTVKYGEIHRKVTKNI